MTCQFCGDALTYAGCGRIPTCCWRETCRLAYTNLRSREYQARKRAGAPPRQAPRRSEETAAAIESRIARAKAVRIAARRAGDPYWHIEPWQQRQGAGACNANADLQGGGYR